MNLPVEVLDAVAERRCVLFLGSHATREAAQVAGREVPTGTDLAKALGWKRPRLMPGARPKPITPSVSDGAGSYQEQHGRPALVARMSGLLGAHGLLPTRAHAVALSHFDLVFTTCRDDLLERAAQDAGSSPLVLYRGDPLPRSGSRAIYKLEGGFERPGSLVLTARDRVAFAPTVAAQVRSLLRKHVVLFVGYRPDEEELDLVWQDLTACFGGELPRCHLSVAQGRISDYQWQRWVWRGLLMFTADPSEFADELVRRLEAP